METMDGLKQACPKFSSWAKCLFKSSSILSLNPYYAASKNYVFLIELHYKPFSKQKREQKPELQSLSPP